MKNLALRTLTGLVYVGIILAGILITEYTFVLLFSLIIVLCLWEFYGLINATKNTHINRWYNCLGGLLLLAAAYSASIVFITVYLLYLLINLIVELYKKQADPIVHVGYIIFGQIYIALPLSILSWIAIGSTYMPIVPLSLFVFIWINDTGAYIIGSWLGKHRLFERISPKKSWEGFFGGLALTALSSLVFAHYSTQFSVYQWIILSIGVVVFGTFGDLFESLIKRSLGVKDSGNALPGHGGFLDRFDSLLFASYWMLCFTTLLLFIQN